MSQPMPGVSTILRELELPTPVTAALNRMRDEMIKAIGDNLAGLILYGGLARGRYRPSQSDVNLIVLLRQASGAVLDAIAPALRETWRAIRVEPFLLTPQEVPGAALAFATKFFDIKDHHYVLLGEDPFANLTIPRDVLRRHVSESLRNLRFRMRQRLVRFSADADELSTVLAGFARPLAMELLALLFCADKSLAKEDRTSIVFAAAAEAFGLDGGALEQLADLRRKAVSLPDAGALYGRVLPVLDRLIEVAETVKE